MAYGSEQESSFIYRQALISKSQSELIIKYFSFIIRRSVTVMNQCSSILYKPVVFIRLSLRPKANVFRVEIQVVHSCSRFGFMHTGFILVTKHAF